MSNRVFIVGNGMTKFLKPKPNNPDYPQLAKQATLRALRDANITYDQVQHAVIGYVYGDSTSGQRALYEVGMTGIPVVNVNNNCSTGSAALYYACNLVKGGLVDCALALGFDRMFTGSLPMGMTDRSNPMDNIIKVTNEVKQWKSGPFAPQIFGNAGIEHQEKYGTKDEHFAKIAYKNHLHSTNNPYSQFRDKYTLEQVSNSPKIYGPLTKLQCCPTSDGAAAAIVCSEKFMREHKLENQAIEVVGIVLKSDPASSFKDKSLMKAAGYDMTKNAAKELYLSTGITPDQVQVVELHDCFSANELITYEALGLCPEGKAGEYIDRNEFTYGGKYVVNPSGGLISKGHPLGATGLAQCAELCWQLRGMAGPRQAKDVKYALQHNIGLGGAVVVAIYKKVNSNRGWDREDQSADPEVLEKIEQSVTAKLQEQSIEADVVSPNAKMLKSYILLEQAKNYCSKVGHVYNFIIKTPNQNKMIYLTLDLKTDPGSLKEGANKSPDAVVLVQDEDLVDLANGKLTVQNALQKQKMKIKGKVGAISSFTTALLGAKPKL